MIFNVELPTSVVLPVELPMLDALNPDSAGKPPTKPN